MQTLKIREFLLAALSVAIVVVGLPASAEAQPGLTLEKAYARLAESPYAPRKPGLLKVEGLLDDSDPSGQFLAGLLANEASITVVIDTGFELSVDFTGCELTRRGARCASDASGMRVRLVVTQYRGESEIYRVKLRVKDIDLMATGYGPLTGAVQVSLTQADPGVTRTDSLSIDECRTHKDGAVVRCKAD